MAETSVAGHRSLQYGPADIGGELVYVTRVHPHPTARTVAGEHLSEVHGVRARDQEPVGWVATDAELREAGILRD